MTSSCFHRGNFRIHVIGPLALIDVFEINRFEAGKYKFDFCDSEKECALKKHIQKFR